MNDGRLRAVATSGRTDDDAVPLAAGAWVVLSLAGVACGMTLLFLGMRAVMEVGGACAEGTSPYALARPCPRGAPAAMIGGLWGGIVCLGIYLWHTTSRGIPSLAVLAWPALFLSLGWNFLELALRPPGGGGPAWGWLVSGAVFVAMGVAPLGLMGAARRVRRFKSVHAARPPTGPGSAAMRARAAWWLALQLLAVGVGIRGGVALFRLLTA